jgi:hypothetical protein
LLRVFTIFDVLEGPIHGGNELEMSAIKGTMNHAKPSFSTEICAGAIISVVQYLAPLRYEIYRGILSNAMQVELLNGVDRLRTALKGTLAYFLQQPPL